MAGLEIVPFGEDHLADASQLLAERHRRHRQAEPLLPGAYEDPAAARVQIEAALGAEDASGVAAYDGGSMAGYMIGRPRPESLWGQNVWIDAAAHAAVEPETVRDLYAAAAVRWWELGFTRQYALVPAFDPHVLDAWWRLGFGHQQAMAIREVHPQPWPEHVRQATTADLDALVALEPLVDQTHRESPVFSEVYRDDDPETLRREYIDDLADDTVATLVYERDGRIPGALAVVPIEHSTMHAGLVRPDGQCLLSFAATLPDDRGSGVGRALTEGALAWASESGYSAMATDWRVTNLLSSRFWTHRGFRPTFLRLYRSLP